MKKILIICGNHWMRHQACLNYKDCLIRLRIDLINLKKVNIVGGFIIVFIEIRDYHS